jgi:5'-nucleotidase/UDP-sugar diphosphatase
LNWNTFSDKELTINSELYKYAMLDDESNVKLMVDQYKDRLSRLLSENIGVTNINLNTKKRVIRKGASNFANVVTDALKTHTDADIAIMNAGNIRGDKIYLSGQVLRRQDIINELPYRSKAVVLNITGKQIEDAIEHGLSKIDFDFNGGRFLHVSGITAKYNSKNKIGSRVISVKYQGVLLNPNKLYKVAMSDYLAGGGDDFSMWDKAKPQNHLRQQNILISDIVTNYIRKLATIEPMIKNRLVDVSVDVLR